jgi:hypothetical protein
VAARELAAGESVLDLEGAFYKLNGDYERTDGAWFGVVSVLLPGPVPGCSVPEMTAAARAEGAAARSPGIDSRRELMAREKRCVSPGRFPRLLH